MAFKVYYHANVPKQYEGWLDGYIDQIYDTLAPAQIKRDELIAYAGDDLIECRVDEVVQ